VRDALENAYTVEDAAKESLMSNPAYNIVCDALSRIVSRRAAENIVTDALRGAKLTAQNVRPEQMQLLLKNTIFVRLQQIIPVAQAKGEIRQILLALEENFSATRSFSPEVEEGWLSLRAEFARVTDRLSPRAQRLAKGIEDLPNSADPVRVLNDLWAELDLLQLELSSSASAVLPELRFQNDLMIETGEFSSFNFELEHLPLEQTVGSELSPVLGRPGAGLPARMNQDLNLTIIDEPHSPVIFESVVETQAVSGVAPALEVAPLELGLEMFASVVAPGVVKSVPLERSRVSYDTAEAQESLLTKFALEEGVTGVLLSKRNGDVIMSRLSSGSANHLAGVVAATTMLLAKRHQFRVFYTHLESVSAFIAPLEDQLLTVLADATVNVGRVFTELESLKEFA
jgi:predicted regulator of Ras-like GTPase activity (Roadblock/LC7/MglB family)